MKASRDCIKRVNHSKVKVEENSRRAVFLNSSREEYEVAKIDGCLVKNEVCADFLVSDSGCHSVVVELKGTDVDHACTQLFATVEHNSVRPLLRDKLGFVIICHHFPRIDTIIQRAKQRCSVKYGAGLQVYCDRRELEIQKVVSINGKG